MKYIKTLTKQNIDTNSPQKGFCAVCFAKIRDGKGEAFDIYPEARAKEVDLTTNPTVKAQKIAVWSLLEASIKTFYNLNMKDLNFIKSPFGKWQTDGLCFSLSHTKNLVCVGISDFPIGVDVENVSEFLKKVKNPEDLFNKITTKEEKDFYKNPSIGRLSAVWTQKESVFKREGNAVFKPSQIQTINANVFCEELDIFEKFIFSVATDLAKCDVYFQEP